MIEERPAPTLYFDPDGESPIDAVIPFLNRGGGIKGFVQRAKGRFVQALRIRLARRKKPRSMTARMSAGSPHSSIARRMQIIHSSRSTSPIA